jgi:hypothetical protein
MKMLAGGVGWSVGHFFGACEKGKLQNLFDVNVAANTSIPFLCSFIE